MLRCRGIMPGKYCNTFLLDYLRHCTNLDFGKSFFKLTQEIAMKVSCKVEEEDSDEKMIATGV